MDDIKELLRGFELKFTPEGMFNYFSVHSIFCQSSVLALKEFTLTKLAEITQNDYDTLQDEFEEYHSTYLQNAIADFLIDFGEVSNPPMNE